MRVLVTGGTGFLGSAACQALLSAGEEVVAYDLVPGDFLAKAIGAERARALTVRGDVTDAHHLLRTLSERRIDTIVHLASLLALESAEDTPRAVRVICGGMVNVLEAARLLRLRRVVWAGSAGVFGGYSGEELIANDAPYAPTSVYRGAKVLNEVLATHYTRAYAVDTIGLRFQLVTGAGKRAGGNSSAIGVELIDKPLRGEPGRVPFGDDSPDWLWVGDAVRAIVLATTVPSTSSRSFNITGDQRSIREAVEIVRSLLPGARITVEAGTANLTIRLDPSAAERELGYAPQWKLEDQLRAMIDQARRPAAAAG